MATISEALSLAIEHHHAGRLETAEQIYRQILLIEPSHADATHLLGVIAHQSGKYELAAEYIERAIELKRTEATFHNNLGEAYRAVRRISEAADCYRRALELRPDLADAHNNLGVALMNQEKPDEATACFRRATELRPDYAVAHTNLGNALVLQGSLNEAVGCFRRALELKPDFAEAYNTLGNVLTNQGKTAEAVANYRRCLALRPDDAEVHTNLGHVLKNQGDLEEAAACCRRAIELKPDLFVAHNNLGNALTEQGKLEDAVACYRRALDLNPNFAEANANLGAVLKSLGRTDEAIVCCRRAIELKPDFADAYNNLGVTLMDLGELTEAAASCRYAIELEPDFSDAYNNLGVALKDQGNLNEAINCYRRAVALRPDYAQARSNLLLTLQYSAGVTLSALAEAHAEYDRQLAEPLRSAIPRHAFIHDRDGRIRLGFVSPDLGQHPVGHFLVRVLENLSHAEIETTCYSDRTVKDSLTHRLQAAVTTWHDTHGISDQRLAEQIAADRIDILFDLAGHTARNRLLVFARKPAPIQITWIGYEGTTGLATMDYLLSDRHVIPDGSQQYYREQILQMPDGYLCYDPPAAAPAVSPLPSLKNGYVTFGSFSNPAKITAEVVAVWAKILRQAPTSRLVLKYRGFGDLSVQRRFCALFADHGVEPRRLELLSASSYAEYLATYHQVDVALDPFPFSGSAITCEALWMGVPAITCPFETFASRHTLSHLSNIGLTETIAGDLDEYVELAVSLAGDLPRLAELRASLRQRMAASPLCDGRRFADNLTKVLRAIWQARLS